MHRPPGGDAPEGPHPTRLRRIASAPRDRRLEFASLAALAVTISTAGAGTAAETVESMLTEVVAPLVVMWRRTTRRERRARIRYLKQGTKPYPADSYPRVLQAMAIDARVALEATSWGLGQVMGGNHVDAGYDSAAEMVAAFLEEASHLEAAISFILANHLDDELREHRWAAFAAGYNGPKYRVNAYDTKLAAAYAKWAKIKDTPWSPPAAGTVPASKPAAPALCPTCKRALTA